MGFFGEIIDSENTFETDVPDGYTLNITQACLDPSSVTPKGKVAVLKVITANEERPIIVCILNSSSGSYHASLRHEFGPEDSPISFSLEGDGEIHLSGIWSWDEKEADAAGCGHDHADTDSENECGAHGDDSEDDDEDEEDDEDDEDEDEEEEEEAPELVVVPTKNDKKRARASSSDSTSAKPAASSSSSSSSSAKPKQEEKVVPVAASTAVAVKESNSKPKDKKQKTEVKVAESEPISMDPAASTKGNMRKKWRVKPQNDEGILILEPKILTKKTGVTVTDYVMGKGAEPKLGTKLKITYEGMFPDGTVFDAALKRTKPFSFRKGTGQVIKGLDYGMEGMKVGGSREIIVPSELGYGSEGIGEIPGNQTLVFRVTLVGVSK